MILATATKKGTQRQKKVDKVVKFSRDNYPFTWLRGLRLLVQFVVTLIFNGALFGLAVTWLTLPVQAPPTPWSITTGTIYVFQLLAINAVIPFMALAIFFLLGAIFGRFMCGWACPMGLVQELLALVPVRKYEPPSKTNKSWSELATLFAGSIIILVVFLGLARALGSTEAQLTQTFYVFAEDPLPAIDPAAALFSFIPYMFYWNAFPAFDFGTLAGLDIFFFWGRLLVLFVILVIPIIIPRAYCRYICPTGAIMGRFNKYSILSINRNPVLCSDCGQCDNACPMGVRVSEWTDRVRDPMCVGCMDCAYACEEGAIQLKVL